MILAETAFLNRIAQLIFDKKGTNILGLDVRGISSLTDYVIIAEGYADRHVIAIANAVVNILKQEGLQAIRVEGLGSGDWVVIDFFDVIVHLFMPGLRDKYRLEELWREGLIIDFKICLLSPS